MTQKFNHWIYEEECFGNRFRITANTFSTMQSWFLSSFHWFSCFFTIPIKTSPFLWFTMNIFPIQIREKRVNEINKWFLPKINQNHEKKRKEKTKHVQARIKTAATYGKTDHIDRRCLVSHAVIYNCFVLNQVKWFG